MCPVCKCSPAIPDYNNYSGNFQTFILELVLHSWLLLFYGLQLLGLGKYGMSGSKTKHHERKAWWTKTTHIMTGKQSGLEREPERKKASDQYNRHDQAQMVHVDIIQSIL